MIKAYIKEHAFNLPIEHADLIQQVKETVYKGEEFSVPSVSFRFPLTKTEGNDCLKVEKQKTNIFLLNFLLLVLKKENKTIESNLFCSDNHIITTLNELTDLNLDKDFENIEKSLIEFLNGEKEESFPFVLEQQLEQSQEPGESEQTEQSQEPGESKQPDDILDNVQFSMAWVKAADARLKELKSKKEG